MGGCSFSRDFRTIEVREISNGITRWSAGTSANAHVVADEVGIQVDFPTPLDSGNRDERSWSIECRRCRLQARQLFDGEPDVVIRQDDEIEVYVVTGVTKEGWCIAGSGVDGQSRVGM